MSQKRRCNALIWIGPLVGLAAVISYFDNFRVRLRPERVLEQLAAIP